jgi:hypothetical protein
LPDLSVVFAPEKWCFAYYPAGGIMSNHIFSIYEI